jgi:ubiquinone/menaquinone biosynthesis C-methylase UbiE
VNATLPTGHDDVARRAFHADAMPWRDAASHEAVAALYADLAPSYDVFRAAWALTLGRRIEATVDDWIRRYVAPSPAVLDLACGTGANLLRLLRLGLRPRAYLGLDASVPMLRVARARFARLPFAAFVARDVHDVDETVGPFDLVLSTYALSHVARPRSVMEASRRLLAPGGRAIFAFFTTPRPPLRRLLRPLEDALAFRCVPPDVWDGLPGLEETATFQHGLMAAVRLAAPTSGREG